MELVRTRYSALKLGEPPPSAGAVQAMLESAAHAPDHGRLHPWRVILIEGDARFGFGDVLAEALSRRNLSPTNRRSLENGKRRCAHLSSS
jgi:nitroreductase